MKPVPPLAHRFTPRDAFRADVGSRIGAEKDAQGRVWCQLFPLGEWHRSDFPGGKLELTASLFEEFVSNWKAGGSPALPVDYNHDEQGPASGWIEDLRIGASGCLEGAVKWTDDAAAEIKADKRRYLSPTWSMQHVSRTSGEKGGPWLYGAALLNDPFFDSMPRVAATASTQHQPHKEQDMSLARIAAVFGLNPNASEDVVVAAAEELKKSHASAGEEAGKLKAAHKSAADELTKLTARNAELEEGAKKHAAALFERDFSDIFEAGIKEGRQGLPELKETLRATALVPSLGLDAAKKMIAALPKVPLTEKGIGSNDGDTKDKAKKAEVELDAFVAEQMKAGKSYTEAMRAANSVKRSVVESAFAGVTSTTKPPPAS